ncbi:glycosyltransferase [Candidatus Pacearchaeota archaeon]|nr:glycosyltransferase [Candidatus Pacearchaeota archaeon]
MEKGKISFIIPAHNEEKIISETLNNLINFPLKEYEVLIGLDGCTDKTKDIVISFVSKSKKFKYFELKSRSGKPEVVDYLVKKAMGEIIVINDADWIFNFEGKEKLNTFFNMFKDKKIGGIAESFPVEWNKDKLKTANFWYKVVAYGNYFWIESQKTNFTKKFDGSFLYITEPAMFLTNIFRKNLYKKNFSLGDDFERTRDIKNLGFEIVIFNKENIPRMIAVYDKIKLKDLLRQKIRTGVARSQLSNKNGDLKKYQTRSGILIIFNSWKSGFFPGLYANLWLLITILGSIIAKFKKNDTKEGWLLRAKRQ